MKRFLKLFLWLAMIVCLNVSTFTTAAAGLFSGTETGDCTDTGSEGTLTWQYDYDRLSGTATLTLSGDGYMMNYSTAWYEVQALKGCAINKLVIKEGVKSIAESAFSGETSLKSVTLPDSLEIVGDYAFYGTGITTVNITKNLVSFSPKSFNLDEMTSYTVSADNPNYTAVNGVLYSKDMTRLIAYPTGKYRINTSHKYTFPESVREISQYAFINSPMTAISIPGTVKEIGDSAFYNCTSLKSVEIEYGVEKIHYNAFFCCESLKSVHIPRSVTYIGSNAFGYVTAIDYEGLEMLLDDAGISHDKITISNISYYAALVDFSPNDFVYFAPDDSYNISAPQGSQAEIYAQMNGINFTPAAAKTPALVSAKSGSYGITVQWEISSDSLGYNVFRKTNGGDWCYIATVEGVLSTSYTDPNPVTNTQNYYTVVAYNELGNSGYNNNGVGTFYVKTPVITAVKSAEQGLCVSWDLSGADSYVIYRKNPLDLNGFSLLGTCNAVTNSFTDTSAVAGQVYEYAVKGVFGYYSSVLPENGVEGLFLESPENLTAQNTVGGVSLSFMGHETETGYNIYRYSPRNNQWVKIGYTEENAYTDKSPRHGETNIYAVTAEIDGFESGMGLNSAEVLYVRSPEIKNIVICAEGLRITWSPVSGAVKYIAYCQTEGEALEKIGEISGDKAEFICSAPQNGEVCVYYTEAVLESGAVSAPFGKEYVDLTAPENLVASNSSDGIYLSWDVSAGATGYGVYRRLSDGAVEYLGYTASAEYTDCGASEGESYTYFVIPQRGDISGEISSESENLLFVNTPRIQLVESTALGVFVKFGKSQNEDKILIYRQTDGEFVLVGEITGDTFFDPDGGDNPVYKAVAVKNGVFSDYSNSVGINV